MFSGFSLLALHFAISFYVVFKKNTLTCFSPYNKITDVPYFLNLKRRETQRLDMTLKDLLLEKKSSFQKSG